MAASNTLKKSKKPQTKNKRANNKKRRPRLALQVLDKQKAWPIPVERWRRLLRRALGEAGVRSGEVAVAYLTRAPMRRLNREFLGRDEDTDVLAFDRTGRTTPGEGRSRPLTHIEGDIAVCIPIVKQQAKTLGIGFEEELLRCSLHGVLHLMGYDDSTRDQARRMRRRQERILRLVGAPGLGAPD